MSYQWSAALTLHQLGTLIWVGGMFFAHFALRPALGRLFDPTERLPVMMAVFQRFFPYVWGAIVLLWGSGLWIFLGLFGGKAGMHVHAMMGLAAIMTVIFCYIWFMPYRQMRAAMSEEDWPAAGSRLTLIRWLILANLLLGLVTAVLGAAGPALLASGS
jgi:uncharacterized membrane protein